MIPDTFTQRGVPGVTAGGRHAGVRRSVSRCAGRVSHVRVLLGACQRVLTVIVYRDTLSMSSQDVSTSSSRILLVPKLWNETIEAHRRAVRDAILDTTAALVAEHGLRR